LHNTDQNVAKNYSDIKREQWDAIDYGSWFLTKKGKLVDAMEKNALLKALKGKHYGTMLDIGIANGRQAEVYHSFIDSLVGIDISPKQLDYAKERTEKLGLKAEFKICGDASRLDFPDQSFDAIICTRVLQHLYDWKAAIKDFNRVLKPGGDLILITYNRFSIYGLVKWFQHKFADNLKGRFRNPIDIRRELKKNNFELKYYAGAMIAQPSAFPSFLLGIFKSPVSVIEHLDRSFPFKFFGERQIIRAKKIS
jgi:ubiquinone/menaquinone biosynthesis C-methylase UbiE